MVQERRQAAYNFPSVKAMQSYFKDWIPEEQILDCMARCADGFRIRQGVSREETELQFVKKCEHALFASLFPGVGRQPRA